MNTMKTLYRHNIKVPEEIAVVSYDVPNYTENESILTVAEQQAYNFGYIGIQLLIERIEGAAPEKARKIVLPSDIHLRASSLNQRD
jgi:LacI family transcriptional regulator